MYGLSSKFIKTVITHKKTIFKIQLTLLIVSAIGFGIYEVNKTNPMVDDILNVVPIIETLNNSPSPELKNATVKALKLYVSKNSRMVVLFQTTDKKDYAYVETHGSRSECQDAIAQFKDKNMYYRVNNILLTGKVTDEQSEVICNLPKNEIYIGMELKSQK